MAYFYTAVHTDIEQNIADSRVIIAENENDIEFIRSLDTANLHSSNGELRDDITTLLKKHGYDDLGGKSEDDIRHMLTAIEVEAIEQNGVEAEKIERWADRHDVLRREAKETVQGHTSDDHNVWADKLASRDPEQLARTRLEAISDNRSSLAEDAKVEVLGTKVEIETQSFSL